MNGVAGSRVVPREGVTLGVGVSVGIGCRVAGTVAVGATVGIGEIFDGAGDGTIEGGESVGTAVAEHAAIASATRIRPRDFTFHDRNRETCRHEFETERSMSSDTPIASGRVIQVNVSAGGVPKLPVDRAWVSTLRVEGDAHREATVHGGPHRAVCLFGIEAIERLQSEGHPVEAGSVGENLTTAGVEWSLLPVGTRARIGDDLELELSSSTTPCSTQTHNFRDGKFSRISIQQHPSDSRMYARVLHEGEVRPGDPITVLPRAPESRATEHEQLHRLDRAEAKSAVAAGRAAAEAGYDVRILEDGDLAMAASPQIAGPGFNHAVGLAQMPNLVHIATDFFDRNGCTGWLITDSPPWPDAERGLVVDVLAGAPDDVPEVPAPEGIVIRAATEAEGPAVEAVYSAAESTGIAHAAVNPWPAVYGRVARHPHRRIVVAELDGQVIAVSSLHVHRKAGWLRGAAVVPEARGRGLQRALISARVRLAAELGCDLVGAWAEEGQLSTANLQRMGLRRIGSREHYVYSPPGLQKSAGV